MLRGDAGRKVAQKNESPWGLGCWKVSTSVVVNRVAGSRVHSHHARVSQNRTLGRTGNRICAVRSRNNFLRRCANYGEVNVCTFAACRKELGIDGRYIEFLRRVGARKAVRELEGGGLSGREHQARDKEGKQQEEAGESPP